MTINAIRTAASRAYAALRVTRNPHVRLCKFRFLRYVRLASTRLVAVLSTSNKGLSHV